MQKYKNIYTTRIMERKNNIKASSKEREEKKPKKIEKSQTEKSSNWHQSA